jgi:hypothetical protein
MLDVALKFVADELNAFLAVRTGTDTVQVKLTRFPSDTGNKYAFDEGSLGLTVINLEEERTVRSQLPTQSYVNGQNVVREPDIKINLHTLIGANFKQYDEALRYLSLVMVFFQSHPVFTSDQYPALDPAIERLAVDLQSPTYEQLNQIWGFVGAKQLPSAIYRMRLVALQDTAPASVRPPVTEITTAMSGR